jgi:Holliday junction resolvase RusA-like endonuclease
MKMTKYQTEMQGIKSDADVILHVPGKPISVNRMYGGRRDGTKFLTKEAEQWERFVCYMSRAATAHLRADIRAGALTLPLRVRCTFYRTRCDADNLLKATLDGLKAGLGIDDKHFAQVEAVKSPKVGDTLIEIWATPVQAIDYAVFAGIERAMNMIKEQAR